MPSETPPLCRVSSTTRTAANSSGDGCDRLDRERRQPAQVEDRARHTASSQSCCGPPAQVYPVAERDEQDVATLAVQADLAQRCARLCRSPEAGRAPSTRRRRPRGDRGCDSARWARGRRTRGRPAGPGGSRCAAGPAPPPDGSVRRARARGCPAGPRPSCRCGSDRRSRAGRRGRRPGRPFRCGTDRWRRSAGWRPRRAADPRRCAGRRGTGSRAWARTRQAPLPSATPRMVCSSSRVSNTRWPPKRFRRARVTPYTPPLTATSSPKTRASGWAAIRSARVALMACARVIRGPDSGRRPPHAWVRFSADEDGLCEWCLGRGGRAGP